MEEIVFENRYKRECQQYANWHNLHEIHFQYEVRRKWTKRGFKGYVVVRFPISERGIQIYLDRKAEKAKQDALKLAQKG